MASSTSPNIPMAILLCLSLLLPSALAGVICEDLPQDLCAFAVSATSKRCLLESYHHSGGQTEYQCRTSEVVVERMADWVETDECVHECGVDRNMIGISSDSLLEPQLTAKLCSVTCYQNCPNIIDLYYNLAAGEGVFLPQLCEAQRRSPHRAMLELLSSGVAAGPVSTAGLAPADASQLNGWNTPAVAPALPPAFAASAYPPTAIEWTAPADAPALSPAEWTAGAPALSPAEWAAPADAPALSPAEWAAPAYPPTSD